MGVPVLDKTWQIAGNTTVATTGNGTNDEKTALLNLKNKFIGFGSNPWTVQASNNTTVANSSDNWTTISDIQDNSWIRLRNTNISSTFEILIFCNAISSRLFTMYASLAGFTGGTTSSRPTATDEFVISTAGTSGGMLASGTNNWVNTMWHSSDGQATFWVTMQSGNVMSFGIIQKPKNPVGSWTQHVATFSNQSITISDSARAEYATFWNTARLYSYLSAVRKTWFMFTEAGSAGTPLVVNQNVANGLDGSWPVTPIGFGTSTGSPIGRHAELWDIWMVAPSLNNGDTMPSAGTKLFAVFGDFLLPWNGTTPVVA